MNRLFHAKKICVFLFAVCLVTIKNMHAMEIVATKLVTKKVIEEVKSRDKAQQHNTFNIEKAEKLFCEAYDSCSRALYANDFESARSIVESYRAVGNDSDIALDHAQILTSLYEDSVGKIDSAYTLEFGCSTQKPISEIEMKEARFVESYDQCSDALQAGDFESARSIVEAYRAVRNESDIAYDHARMLTNLYEDETGTVLGEIALSSSTSASSSVSRTSEQAVMHKTGHGNAGSRIANQSNVPSRGFRQGPESNIVKIGRVVNDKRPQNVNNIPIIPKEAMQELQQASSMLGSSSATPLDLSVRNPHFALMEPNPDGARKATVVQPQAPVTLPSSSKDPAQANASTSQTTVDSQRQNEVPNPAQNEGRSLSNDHSSFGSRTNPANSSGEKLAASTTSQCTNWSSSNEQAEPLVVGYADGCKAIAHDEKLLQQHVQALQNFIDKFAHAPYTMSVTEIVRMLEQSLPALERVANDRVNHALSEPLRKFQARLANILFDEHGAYKGITNVRDRNKWAYVVADFVKTVSPESYKQRITALAEQGCLGFDVVANGRSADMGRIYARLQRGTFDAKYHNWITDFGDKRYSKGALSTNKFNKDIQSIEAAIARGDQKSAEQIVNLYRRDKAKLNVLNDVRAKAQQRADAEREARLVSSQPTCSSSQTHTQTQPASQQTYQVDALGIILDDASMPKISNEMCTDFVTTNAYVPNSEDYVLVPRIMNSAFRRELIETFKLIGDICLETKDQGATLLQRQYDRTLLKKVVQFFSTETATGAGDLVAGSSTSESGFSYNVAERSAKFCAAVDHLRQSALTPTPEFNERIRDLMHQGRFDEADLAVLDATVGTVLKHMADNLENLPTFMLQAVQGTLHAGRFVKNIVLEAQIDHCRTPAEYNQVMIARLQKWDDFVQGAQDMPADQVKAMACKLAADILTLDGLVRAAEFARSSQPVVQTNTPTISSREVVSAEQKAVTPAQAAVKIEAEVQQVSKQAMLTGNGQLTNTTSEVAPAVAGTSAEGMGTFGLATEEAAVRTGQVAESSNAGISVESAGRTNVSKLTVEQKAVGDILKDCTPGEVTSCKKTQQFNKHGTVHDVLKDFESYNLDSVNTVMKENGFIKYGTLPDGTKIIARDHSKGKTNYDGWPTLEFQFPNKKYIKIRYIDEKV